MVITKISRLRKRGRRFLIAFDDRETFELGYSTLLKHGLHIGDSLTDEKLNTMRLDDILAHAKDLAVNYLSYRPRSTKELKDYLTRKGIPEETAKVAIRNLESLKMLDDVQFAQIFVRDKIARKSVGEALLREKLWTKGIAPGTISQVMKSLVTNEGQQKAALALVSKRMRVGRSLSTMDPVKKKKRLYEFLLRRGFSHEIAKKTIRTIFS